MSRSHMLLGLSVMLCIGTEASAQTCFDEVGVRTRATNVFTTGHTAPGYGYSRFQPSINFTGRTCGFAEACRECGCLNSDARGWMGRPNLMGRNRYEPVNRFPHPDRYEDGLGRTNNFISWHFNGRSRSNDWMRSDGQMRSRNPMQFDDRFRSNRDIRWNSGRPSDTQSRSSNELRYPGVPRYDYGFTRTQPARRPALRWHTDLRQAAQVARTNPRPMLVNVTADWCTHCVRMKDETFTDARLIQSLNTAGYIPVRLDADANKELVQRIGVTSLPTTLIVSPDLKIEARLQGFRSAAQLSQSLRQYDRNAEVQTEIQVAAK